MLKTSNTELIKPRKSVVGAGGGGKNKAEPVGKHEVDRVDDGGGCNGDFVRKFYLLYDSRTTHFNAQDKLINGLIN